MESSWYWKHVDGEDEYEVLTFHGQTKTEIGGGWTREQVVYRSVMDGGIYVTSQARWNTRFKRSRPALSFTPIAVDQSKTAVQAFDKRFKDGGYQYGQSALDNARAWYVNGYHDALLSSDPMSTAWKSGYAQAKEEAKVPSDGEPFCSCGNREEHAPACAVKKWARRTKLVAQLEHAFMLGNIFERDVLNWKDELLDALRR